MHIPEDRAKGLTHIVYVTFKTREDLESVCILFSFMFILYLFIFFKKYLTHPEHVAVKGMQLNDLKISSSKLTLITEIQSSMVKDKIVMDYEVVN